MAMDTTATLHYAIEQGDSSLGTEVAGRMTESGKGFVGTEDLREALQNTIKKGEVLKSFFPVLLAKSCDRSESLDTLRVDKNLVEAWFELNPEEGDAKTLWQVLLKKLTTGSIFIHNWTDLFHKTMGANYNGDRKYSSAVYRELMCTAQISALQGLAKDIVAVDNVDVDVEKVMAACKFPFCTSEMALSGLLQNCPDAELVKLLFTTHFEGKELFTGMFADSGNKGMTSNTLMMMLRERALLSMNVDIVKLVQSWQSVLKPDTEEEEDPTQPRSALMRPKNEHELIKYWPISALFRENFYGWEYEQKLLASDRIITAAAKCAFLLKCMEEVPSIDFTFSYKNTDLNVFTVMNNVSGGDCNTDPVCIQLLEKLIATSGVHCLRYSTEETEKEYGSLVKVAKKIRSNDSNKDGWNSVIAALKKAGVKDTLCVIT
jgi:hypothetical protein